MRNETTQDEMERRISSGIVRDLLTEQIVDRYREMGGEDPESFEEELFDADEQDFLYACYRVLRDEKARDGIRKIQNGETPSNLERLQLVRVIEDRTGYFGLPDSGTLEEELMKTSDEGLLKLVKKILKAA